jgi:acetyl esterase/lipase
MFSVDAAREGAGLYLQGVDADDPLASPVFADLAGFPPVLLFAGGDEVLLADGLELASRLALAGATVEAYLVAGMQHVWPTMQADLPESVRALAAMAGFVDTVACA